MAAPSAETPDHNHCFISQLLGLISFLRLGDIRNIDYIYWLLVAAANVLVIIHISIPSGLLTLCPVGQLFPGIMARDI